jgi:hypothetical protein
MEMLTEEEKDEYNKVTHIHKLKTTLSEMREEKIEMLKPENSEEIKNPTDQEKKESGKEFCSLHSLMMRKNQSTKRQNSD